MLTIPSQPISAIVQYVGRESQFGHLHLVPTLPCLTWQFRLLIFPSCSVWVSTGLKQRSLFTKSLGEGCSTTSPAFPSAPHSPVLVWDKPLNQGTTPRGDVAASWPHRGKHSSWSEPPKQTQQIWGDFYLSQVARRGDAAASSALGGADPPNFFPALSSVFSSMNLSDNAGKNMPRHVFGFHHVKYTLIGDNSCMPGTSR